MMWLVDNVLPADGAHIFEADAVTLAVSIANGLEWQEKVVTPCSVALVLVLPKGSHTGLLGEILDGIGVDLFVVHDATIKKIIENVKQSHALIVLEGVTPDDAYMRSFRNISMRQGRSTANHCYVFCI